MMVFFEQGWGKFEFGKNFLKRESPTLIILVRFCRRNRQTRAGSWTPTSSMMELVVAT